MTGFAPDASANILRREDVIAERVLDETVILDPRSDTYVRLNTSGRLLWEALSQPRRMQELADRLAAEFGLDPPRAQADAAAFVAHLAERGLVEVSK